MVGPATKWKRDEDGRMVIVDEAREEHDDLEAAYGCMFASLAGLAIFAVGVAVFVRLVLQ
jgi:hypothetical protein